MKYGYDYASNRQWRRAGPDMATPPAGKDEYYAYDGLHRLTDAARGDYSGTGTAVTNRTFGQNWEALESQGDWRKFKQDSAGSGTFTGPAAIDAEAPGNPRAQLVGAEPGAGRLLPGNIVVGDGERGGLAGGGGFVHRQGQLQ